MNGNAFFCVSLLFFSLMGFLSDVGFCYLWNWTFFFPFTFRAVYIRRKYGNKQLSQSIYLSEAETFLEQYAKRSLQNQALIGSAGNFVRAEDFLAIVEGGRDGEGDLEMEREIAPLSPSPSVKDIVPKKEGLIVFFPGKNICNWLKFCLFFFNEVVNN